MKAYVLASLEGVHLSSVNAREYLGELNLLRFLNFSATLFGLYNSEKVVEYRFGDYLCTAVRIPTTRFVIIILNKLYSGATPFDANTGIFISLIILHYLTSSLFVGSFAQLSSTVEEKCIQYNEKENDVTNLNSNDIMKCVEDEIQQIQELLEHLEEHYLYEWLKLPDKEILNFESVKPLSGQHQLMVSHYHYSCTKWKSDNTHYKSCLVPRLYVRIVSNGNSNNQGGSPSKSEEFIIQISASVSVDIHIM